MNRTALTFPVLATLLRPPRALTQGAAAASATRYQGWQHSGMLTLKLKASSTAKQITYLKEIAWSQDTLLNGANGLPALTFCEVPVQPGQSSR